MLQRREFALSDRALHVQDEPYPGAPPLAIAAWKGQTEKAKKLLKDGADVNKRGQADDKGATPEAPLVCAINKASHLCRVFGSCLCPHHHTGLQVLALAVERLLHETVKRPLSMLSRLCLDSQLLQGHQEVVRVLLDHGADPNVRAGHSSTPLIYAARLNQPDIMKLLLAKGALFKNGALGTGTVIWVCRCACCPAVQ